MITIGEIVLRLWCSSGWNMGNAERRGGSCWCRSAVKRWRTAPDTHYCPHSGYGSRL